VECHSALPKLDTRLVINGTNIGGVNCSRAGVPGLPVPNWGEQDIHGNGVRLAHRPLVVSLTLLKEIKRLTEVPTTQPGTILGLGLYERDH
jgi:hypothetical protein